MTEEPVRAAIWRSLEHFNYEDAVFLSERLHAEVKDDETLYMLAVSYYRAKQVKAAYELLRLTTSPKCRYLLARCCVDLDQYAQAEQALTGSVFYSGTDTLDKVCATFGDSASFALGLLGNIYRVTKRIEKAAEVYQRALKINPYLWSLFEALVNIGEKPNAAKVFACPSVTPLSVSPKKPTSVMGPPALTCLTTPTVQQTPPTITINTPSNNTSTATSLSRNNLSSCGLRSGPARSVFGGINAITPPTPSFGIIPLTLTPATPPTTNVIAYDTPIAPSVPAVPAAPHRKSKKTQLMNNLFFGGSTSSGDTSNAVRRSTRLYATTGNAVKENNKSTSTTTASSSTASPTRLSRLAASKKKSSVQKNNEAVSKEVQKGEADMNELNKEMSARISTPGVVNFQQSDGLMQLLQQLGAARLHLAQYHCQQCIDSLQSLPHHQFNTPWVLATLGRAHFELANYTQSAHYFHELRRQFPCVLNGLEYYSSALWHLQQEVELSTLSQQLVELDENAAETMCALGNFFSLQKMHEVAIEHLERATERHTNFTYAYTLLGHELLQTEELDKALSCYRKAMLIDSRHYNAWYGIGMVYYRQEQFELAEFHLRKAIEINAFNSVLLCHIGVIQHAQKKPEALATLNKAMKMNSKNALVKFHRASVLYAQDRLQEALEDLNELKQLSPNESLVYFMLGKVHKKLGNEHLALMNLSCATDMDPRGAYTQIKESIDPTSRSMAAAATTPEEDQQSNEGVDVHISFSDHVPPNLMDSDDSF